MNCFLKLRQKRRANSKSSSAKRWKAYTSLPCRWSLRFVLVPIGGICSEQLLFLSHHQCDSGKKIRKETRRLRGTSNHQRPPELARFTGVRVDFWLRAESRAPQP